MHATMDDLDLTALPIVGHGDDEDGKRREPDYPRSWKLAAIITALCLAVFCMALDNTIIATAIPRITDEFGALQDVAWYISTYLLTTASFQLFFGKLYSFYSIKWTFLSAVALFELGSLVCGAAPSSRALIVGRAIAGLGSAGLFSGGLLIIAHTVPLRTRPLYTGAVGSMYGVASVAGPLLGGVFTDHLSWRWCFYINLPLGAITLVFVFFFLHTPPRKDFSGLSFGRKLAKLDILGTTLFVPAIICLILALQWGGLNYDWSDGHIIGLLVAFVVLIAGFLVVQWWRQDNGTVPPRIFLRRSVAAAAWWTFTFGGSFFIMIYFVPIWFQSVWGVSATQSGIDSLPLVLSCALFSVVSGVGITLVGYYTPWLIASSLIMCAGCGVLSTFHPSIPIGQWVGYQIFAGAGESTIWRPPLRSIPAGLTPLRRFWSGGSNTFDHRPSRVALGRRTCKCSRGEIIVPDHASPLTLDRSAPRSSCSRRRWAARCSSPWRRTSSWPSSAPRSS